MTKLISKQEAIVANSIDDQNVDCENSDDDDVESVDQISVGDEICSAIDVPAVISDRASPACLDI